MFLSMRKIWTSKYFQKDYLHMLFTCYKMPTTCDGFQPQRFDLPKILLQVH